VSVRLTSKKLSNEVELMRILSAGRVVHGHLYKVVQMPYG
jgi:hypothetical protein